MGSAYYDAHSLWQLADKPLYNAIHEDVKIQVCIVGAGITGLTTGYMLAKQGFKVLVVDRERLGLGETGLSSAHLSNALDEGYLQLRRLHGQKGARLAAESHTQAIEQIENIVFNEGIECEFQRVSGYLFLKPGAPVTQLIDELDAVHQAGLETVRLLSSAPTRLFETGPCLHYPAQAQMHPLKYLDGLAEAFIRNGGKIMTHTEVTEIKEGLPAHLTTKQGFHIEADFVIVATDVPVNNRLRVLTKNPAYRSYVIGVQVPPELVGPELFWDTESPYHYLRFVKEPGTDQNLLLVGGEDHRTGQDRDPEDHFSKLQRWVRNRLEIEAPIITRWSGQIMEPVDGLAYIGRNPGSNGNMFIATGDSGHGLTHGTIAGLILRDLIMDRPNPWATLYDPARLHWKSIGTLLKEAGQSTIPYGDWLADGDVETIDQIPRGEGAVVRSGTHRVAVHKNEAGGLQTCSAVCSHLGGIVRWNSAEKTWDCPCHGSRFSPDGEVLNGPAITGLAPMSLDGPEPDSDPLIPSI